MVYLPKPVFEMHPSAVVIRFNVGHLITSIQLIRKRVVTFPARLRMKLLRIASGLTFYLYLRAETGLGLTCWATKRCESWHSRMVESYAGAVRRYQFQLLEIGLLQYPLSIRQLWHEINR